MAARTLDKMRKAQSLLRECHSWLVENNEILLAVEFCQIEGKLALLFENNCFTTSPCVGLQNEELPRLPPFNGDRRRIRRGPYNGGRKSQPTNRGGTEASPSRAGGGQNSRAQAKASTSGDTVSDFACRDVESKPPGVQSVVTEVSPPTGVLLDFNDDVEFVQFPPNMVAEMEAAQTSNLRSKGKQRLSEWLPAEGNNEPAPGVSIRVDGDGISLHQTVATAGHAASAGVDETTESQKGDSMKCEELPVPIDIDGVIEDVLIDLDDDLAVILPIGTDADSHSTTHPEEKDVQVASLDSGVGHDIQPEHLEDDEIVFQGNAAKGIRPDFKALFVSSNDDSQTARRAIDLKAIFEKYSEVIICR
ncbi:unnamed protein product [Penicillium glandicola]